MSDAEFTPVVEATAEKPLRKKGKASDAQAKDGVRDWNDVVPEIHRMKEAGASVPEIADALQLSYVLVNQVMLQSYKMTVDTISLFERQEKARLGLE